MPVQTGTYCLESSFVETQLSVLIKPKLISPTPSCSKDCQMTALQYALEGCCQQVKEWKPTLVSLGKPDGRAPGQSWLLSTWASWVYLKSSDPRG